METKNKETLKDIRALIRLGATCDEFLFVYENTDEREDGRIICNLTISWLKPEGATPSDDFHSLEFDHGD